MYAFTLHLKRRVNSLSEKCTGKLSSVWLKTGLERLFIQKKLLIFLFEAANTFNVFGYLPGTAIVTDIADTLYISVEFL
jgi:hypothetical protein